MVPSLLLNITFLNQIQLWRLPGETSSLEDLLHEGNLSVWKQFSYGVGVEGDFPAAGSLGFALPGGFDRSFSC